MNVFIETLNQWGRSALQFAWPMLWQSSLLILAVFALDYALRRKVRAAIRYALWFIVLVKLLLPPSLALPTSIAWWLRSPAAAPAPAVQRVETPTPMVTYRKTTGPLPSPAPAPLPVSPPATRLPVSGAAWALLAWSSVSLGLFFWLGVRWRYVARRTGRTKPSPKTEENPSLDELFGAARRLAGVRGTVRLRLVEGPVSPAVCGVFRPMILLPRSLAEQLPATQLRAVLLHELIHLRRRDVWANCFQSLLQIVYWWHPLLWMANARIRRLREEAVDDAVMLALADDSDAYAATLLEVAKLAFHRPLTALGLVGILESRRGLRARIERLMNFKTPGRAGLSVVSLISIAAFTALALPMGEAPEKPYPAAPAAAPEPHASSPVQSRSSEGTRKAVVIRAGSIDLNVLDGTLTASNHVVIERDGYAVRGDFASFNQKSNKLIIRNAVIVGSRPGVTASDEFTSSSMDNAAVKIETYSDVLFANATSWSNTAGPSGSAGISNTPMDIRADSGLMDLDEAKGLAIYSNNVVVKFDGNTLTADVAIFRREPRSPALPRVGVATNGTVLPSAPPADPARNGIIYTSPARQLLMRKLNDIRLDSVAYDHVPLGEVIGSLTREIKRRDPDRKGVSIVLTAPPVATIDPTTGLPVPPNSPSETVYLASVSITINPPLTNLRVADVLSAIAKGAERPIKYSFQDYAVVFAPKGNEPELFMRLFKVDPVLFAEALRPFGWPPASDTPTPTDTATAPRVESRTTNGIRYVTSTNSNPALAFHRFFATAGLDLDPEKGNVFFYKDREGTVMVRATAADLDLIAAILAKLSSSSAPQVRPATTPANAPRPEFAFAPSATFGNFIYRDEAPSEEAQPSAAKAVRSSSNDPAVPGGATNLPRVETAVQGLPVRQVLVQAQILEIAPTNSRALGFDLGSALWTATNGTAVDSQKIVFSDYAPLANGSAKTPADGLRNIATNAASVHILTKPQMDVVLETMKKEGSPMKLVSEPRLMLFSEESGKVHIGQMIPVVLGVNPDATHRPGIRSSHGTNDLYRIAYTPVGRMLDLSAIIGADDSINLNAVLTLSSVLGYSDTTNTVTVYVDGVEQSVSVPRPDIRQSQARVRATLWDGQTLVVGGLIEEESMRMKDRVPVLGDLPFVGRLFRSESTSGPRKKNIVVFLTPTILKPADPLSSSER